VGRLDKEVLEKVKKAIEISCGLRGKIRFEEYIKYLKEKLEKKQ